MTQIAYRKKYLKIYVWQVLSIVLGFVSLFIVVPFLSSNKILYGIYSICTSLTIFFSYADLGFLNASRKYGAEYYIQNRHEDEIRIVGFVFFLMLVVFLIISTIIIVFAFRPQLLIPDLILGSEEYVIARKLLFILGVSCFFILIQRVLNVVFTIRVEDYKYNRISVIGSMIKILSVFYFFSGSEYKIIEYYAFYHFINLIIAIVLVFSIRQYGYKIKQLLLNIKFDRAIFNKVWKISLTTLIAMLCAMLYLELDQLAISHMFGISASAIYGIALSITNIVRSYCSLVYSPYASRYNHYIGLGDKTGLFDFLSKMIFTLSPLIIFPILVVSITAEPFVISWVGDSYIESSQLVSLMVLSFLPYFIKEPVTNYLYAVEKNRINMRLFVFNPLIYWVGIILSYRLLGLMSFALFKFLAPLLLSILYYWVIYMEFKRVGMQLTSFKKAFLHVVTPAFLCCLTCIIALPFFLYEHSVKALIINLILMGACVCLSIIYCLIFNNTLRRFVIKFALSIIRKN